MSKLNISLLLLSAISLFSCNKTTTIKVTKEGQNTIQVDSIPTEIKPQELFMGIDVENLDIEHGVIPNGKTLSDILSTYRVNGATIHQLAECSKSTFDVRKIRSGNNYHVLLTRDSIPTLAHFIYEINQTEYLTCSFTDSICVKKEQKELTRVKRKVSGEIESSLWNSVVAQNVPFELALELSNIYAWNIDFFSLQKGDKYDVVYTEVRCDSNFVRIDSIECAIFNHCGTDFHAIPFTQNGRRDFFDYEGKSLRKAFLKAPLSYSRISSHFTHKRFHPVLKYYRPHHGVDYAAPTGTPVHTIGDGKVIFKGYTKGGGHTVKIQHNSTYTTCYMHLSKYGKISVGSIVKQGEVIGYVGSTGLSTGPHLDFRVYQNGSPINPLKMKSPPVEPVNPELIDSFNCVRDSVLKILTRRL
ncbi:MAG: peptidoglycan DD-metalloendopeptidase family protein [Paludibacteraceae bacterium]|nr:peptidoglycan DD-metalloendopeptidase family protein [Paludibacteraceae bacterium]